jgi:hypothetical protein
MKATNWEFANRALVFGLIFAFAFPLYSLDHQNSTAALANWLQLPGRKRSSVVCVAKITCHEPTPAL